MNYYQKRTGIMKKKRQNWILETTPHSLQEQVDHDYLDKLSQAELDWLAAFDMSFYRGSKNEVSADWTKEEFKEAFDRNNASARDIFTKCNQSSDSEAVFSTVAGSSAANYGMRPRGRTKKKETTCS